MTDSQYVVQSVLGKPTRQLNHMVLITTKEGDQQTAPVVNKSALPKASFVIVNTNELHHLIKCLPSIFSQDYPEFEVIVVDNASTDGSIEYLEKDYPEVKIIKNKENLGYVGGNNLGFDHISGEYIAVLNPDTKLEPDWLQNLIDALEANPSAGLAACKVLMMDEPSQINSCGLTITFTGLSFCRGLGKPRKYYNEPEVVFGVSGSAFVIRRRVLEEIGGFDENFFIYYEDTDLSLRANLAGYSCLYVPTAVAFHQYIFKFSPRKCYLQERNRYFSLFKTFHWTTIFILLPTLLISELISWGYALIQSPDHLRSKLRSYAWLISNWRPIIEERRKVQRLRRVKDKKMIERFSSHLDFTNTTKPWFAGVLSTIFNPLVLVWGKVCRIVIFW